MDIQKAYQIVLQALEAANKKGTFSLNESTIITQALAALKPAEQKEVTKELA